MTLVVALKYAEGTVLASDTRMMVGATKREGAAKIELLTKNVATTSAGLVGATDDIIKVVRTFCKSSSPISFDSIISSLSDAALEWYRKNKEKLNEEEEEIPVFLVVSPERIRNVLEKGYSEEVHNYDCSGTGTPFAEYILGNSYKENLGEEEAKELAVRTILETSKMDPQVGEDVEVLVCRRKGGCQLISDVETEDLKQRVAPLTRTVAEEQSRVVERIVDLREAINDLCETKFKFRLFHPIEKVIFQLVKPCRSEGEFTTSIAALALLIDQINVKEMKKVIGEKEGSINILQEFATECIGKFPVEIIQTFRDIMTLRSKRFPIHKTDPKFVEVVVRITGSYPPNWSDLYIKSLNSFEQALKQLLNCFKKAQKAN